MYQFDKGDQRYEELANKDENCFLKSVLGCIALHVLMESNPELFVDGEWDR